MNVLVEVALIAVPVPLLAVARDVWIRTRTDRTEQQARADRLEKEKLDRQQAADIAVIAVVPAFLSLDESSAQHELVEERKKNARLMAEIECLKDEIAALTEMIR